MAVTGNVPGAHETLPVFTAWALHIVASFLLEKRFLAPIAFANHGSRHGFLNPVFSRNLVVTFIFCNQYWQSNEKTCASLWMVTWPLAIAARLLAAFWMVALKDEIVGVHDCCKIAEWTMD